VVNHANHHLRQGIGCSHVQKAKIHKLWQLIITTISPLN
jgi:hypothetical protein